MKPIPEIQELMERHKAARIPQMTLAKKAGIGRSSLVALEQGKRRNPTIETLRRLRKALEKLTGEGARA